MERAAAADVIATFGQLDEDLLARILAVGATPGQLLEAKAWMAADYDLGPVGEPPPTGPVKEVCELMEAAEAELTDEVGPAAPPKI